MNRSEVLLRVAQLDDHHAVTELLKRSYSVLLHGWYMPDLLAALMPRIAKANPSLLESGTFYLAEEGSDLLGCGGWTANMPGTVSSVPRLGHIRHFATDPAQTRRGVGGQILARCFEDARSAGLTKMLCFSSLAAENFYAKNGFETIGSEAVMIDETVAMPVIVMERDLVV